MCSFLRLYCIRLISDMFCFIMSLQNNADLLELVLSTETWIRKYSIKKHFVILGPFLWQISDWKFQLDVQILIFLLKCSFFQITSSHYNSSVPKKIY